MGDLERAAVNRLLVADSVENAQMVLRDACEDKEFEVADFFEELRLRHEELVSAGRTAEAQVVAFLTEAAEELRSLMEEVIRRRRQPDGGRGAGPWLSTMQVPADLPRLAAEQQIAVLVDRDQLDEALAAARQAVAIPARDRAELLSIVDARYKLAARLRELGRVGGALEVVRGLELFFPAEQLGAPAVQISTLEIFAARVHLLRGLIYDDVGDHARSRQAYQTALGLAESSGDVTWRIAAWTHLAGSYGRAGRYRQQVDELRRLAEFTWKQRSPEGYLSTLNNLGRALLAIGERDSARRCFFQVLQIFANLEAQGTSKSGAWFGLGDLARAEGDDTAALDAYKQGFWSALAAHDVKGGVFDVLTRVEFGFGGDDELLETAMVFYIDDVKEEERDWQLTWSFRRTVARGMRHRGRYDEAVDLFKDILADVTDKGREVPRAARRDLVDTLMLWHKREQRADILKEAFDILWETRQKIAADAEAPEIGPAALHTLIDDHADDYRNLADLLVDHGRELSLPDSRTSDELAFDVIEEMQAAVYLRHLARAPMPVPDDVPVILREGEAYLLACLADTSPYPSHSNAEVAAQLADIHEQMAPVAPDSVRLRQARPARFADLRAHLRSSSDAGDCAFVSFVSGDEETTVFTYVPRTDRLTVAKVPVSRARLVEVVRRLKRTFNGAPDEFPPVAPIHSRRPWRRDISFLKELTPLLAAFLPETQGSDLLYVSTDGAMSGIPLSAVPTPEGPPLVTEHAVVHVGGASVLLHSAARPRAGAAPDLSRVVCASVAAREDPEPARLEGDAALLSEAGWQVTAIAGVEATRQAVLEALSTADIAHITCHGYADVRLPLDSGLLLAHNGRRPSKLPAEQSIATRLDHLLTVGDLIGQAVPLRLLTLRACTTGVRDEYAGGDLEGLVQALLSAGTGTVAASLWNVDAQSSGRLLVDFYRRLKAEPHRPVWRHFWQAQKRMLEQPGEPWEAHPYHWAALALFGDGGQTTAHTTGDDN